MIGKVVLTIVFLVGYLALVATTPCPAGTKPVICVGINLRYNPITMYKRYQPVMDYLTATTPYRFELKLSRDYLENLRELKNGVTQISILGDVAFVEAQLRFDAIPILKPLTEDGRPFYRSAIIVAHASPLESLTDLKGKRMAFGNLHSTVGNLFPRYLLQTHGVTAHEFASFANFRSHEDVIKAVLRGDYDAGAVSDRVFDVYGRQGLRVLAYSEPVPTSPFVVRKDAPIELVKAVTDTLLKLDRKNPAHRIIMANWDDSLKYGFTTASVGDYRQISRMFKSIPSGCGKGCHT